MNQETINEVSKFVEKEFSKVKEKGHDWWHIYRVWKLSTSIAESEPGADLFVVELGSLLHDIADRKIFNEDEFKRIKKMRNFLDSLDIESEVINHVENIILSVSFSSTPTGFSSRELQIIQDADKLDALGAVGIARAFNYGGSIGREIYNPNIEPNPSMSREEYKKSNSPSINHFYEKLLLLKDKMNTQTGKKIAEERHKFLLEYLNRFYEEWEGKL